MKLLLLSLSTGSGHVRAADAIRQYAVAHYPDVEVRHIDVFDYISTPFQKATVDAYDWIIKEAPELWRFLYYRSDNELLLKQVHRLTRRLKRMNAQKLYEFIDEFGPDYIVSTHFFATDLFLSKREKFGGTTPIATVLTDYRLHELWFIDGTDHYFVPTDTLRVDMIDKGFAGDTVTTSGIPVDPVFYQRPLQHDSTTTQNNIPTVLVMSGGQGLSRSDEVVKALFALAMPLSIVAVAGKNEALEAALRSLAVPAHVSLEVVGWTNKIDTYMREADVIVSKPGGLTTTECIVLGKPLIAINPIPGQEEANAAYLVDQGLGYVAMDSTQLLAHVRAILEATQPVPVPNIVPAAKTILDSIQKETQ